MGVTDNGIDNLGKMVRGVATGSPTHLGFAGGSDAFSGSETALTNEFIRKEVTWTQSGLFSKYSVELSSVEANGSYIKSVGLLDDSVIGSGSLYTYDVSFIGSKTSSFNVQLEGEFIFRRPT